MSVWISCDWCDTKVRAKNGHETYLAYTTGEELPRAITHKHEEHICVRCLPARPEESGEQ